MPALPDSSTCLRNLRSCKPIWQIRMQQNPTTTPSEKFSCWLQRECVVVCEIHEVTVAWACDLRAGSIVDGIRASCFKALPRFQHYCLIVMTFENTFRLACSRSHGCVARAGSSCRESAFAETAEGGKACPSHLFLCFEATKEHAQKLRNVEDEKPFPLVPTRGCPRVDY